MWEGFGNQGGFFISSFGIMLFVAFLSCNLLIKKTLKEKKIDSKIGDDIVFWAAIGGIVGAKLYYYIEYGFSEIAIGCRTFKSYGKIIFY